MQKIIRKVLVSVMAGGLLVTVVTAWRSAPQFALNRTVRSVALRLVQIELLSRSTGSDYQVDFLSDHYRVFVFDHNSSDWILQRQIRFPSGITCGPDDFICHFSQGKMVEFFYRDPESKAPRSVILNFVSERSDRVRSLIFYRQGNWKVLR